MSGQDWLKHPGGFAPGFSGFGEDVTYETLAADGFEFIVEQQYFHSLDEEQLILSQEFILLFSLYRGEDGNYYEVDKSGNKQIAVEFLGRRVRVRTKYLMRYMCAKQLLYVQFVDSRVSSGDHYKRCDTLLDKDVVQNEQCSYFLLYQTNSAQDYLFSMMYARSVVRPGSMQMCRLGPFENDSEDYPEFIIKENPDGTYERFTCEDSRLDNYFGSNPGAPHYLTPVFFKPEVLDRYRKLPQFKVTERRITCGSQWSIEIDNIIPGRVMVFLGDLGRDLPESERRHFLSYEMSPTDQVVADEVIAQDFMNAWIDDTAGPVGHFEIAFSKMKAAWFERFGFSLYRDFHPDDANLEKQIHVPTSDSLEEFETLVQTLAKCLVGYIDEAKLSGYEDSGSINKLSSFLEAQGIELDLTPLRDLQSLRSAAAAHAKGKNYDKLKQRLLTGNAVEDGKALIAGLSEFMLEFARKLEG